MNPRILLIPATFCLLGFSSYVGFDNNADPLEQQQQAANQAAEHWDGYAQEHDRNSLSYFPEGSAEGQIPEGLLEGLEPVFPADNNDRNAYKR